MNKKPTAALYGRVSLEDQASNLSLPSQLRAMEAHAKTKGFAAPKEFQFIEDGLRGNLDRPGLTRLREAVRAGVVKAVIVFDLDRLARKLSDQLLLVDEFESHGAPGPSKPRPKEKCFCK
jgi:site-specific DNA recombinase